MTISVILATSASVRPPSWAETTTLTLRADRPVRTTLYLRYPAWSGKPEVRVNGKKMAVRRQPGSYVAVDRQWQDGDQVTVRYPMTLRLERTPDNPRKAAVLYGPVVLAGERGTEGMVPPAPFSNPALYNDYYTYDYRIPAGLKTSLAVDERRPERSLRRQDGTLTFTTPQGDVLRPLYDLHRQRYVVYWDLEAE